LSYEGKTILVTGGTGSFGRQVVQHALGSGAKCVRILSRDELKQHDMRNELSDSRAEFFIGDVTKRETIRPAMKSVDIVFHAAAYKQVPSCEFFPLSAVDVNVYGSSNVIDTCVEENISTIVLLSTDKAVGPTNVMGMTKALMERLAISRVRINPTSRTNIVCTRYGNVIDSRGSVLPYFCDLLIQGRDLPITSFQMTRFIMSLDEAVGLVDYAVTSSDSGKIYVQKSKKVFIKRLAERLIHLSGAKAKVYESGVRHGEKLHEVLVSQEEMQRATLISDQYFEIALDERTLNYGSYFTEGSRRLDRPDEYSSRNGTDLSDEELDTYIMNSMSFQRLIHAKK
jgi:UDP-N-acetylglucosamine 4,6-dehydratase/5-epimerase